jgi:hypothetical protein
MLKLNTLIGFGAQSAASGDPIAPGLVTLGTPTGDGIPYTMPSLPAGAGRLILEVSSTADFALPYEAATELGGGATGIYSGGRLSLDTAGEDAKTFYFRAKNENGGLTGGVSHTVSVPLPSAPGAPTGRLELDGEDLYFTAPLLPENAATGAALELFYNKNDEGWSDARTYLVPGGDYNVFAVGVPYLSGFTTLLIRMGAVSNIYGTGPEGEAASVTEI